MSRARRLGAVAFIAALALGSSAIPADPIAAGDPLFRDVTRRSGIDFESGFLDVEGFAFVSLMARSSAAAGDYDGDGDIDLFIVRGDIGPNLLYRNDGRLRFTEVAAAAGLAYTRASGLNYRHAGATFADLDGDGHLDLFLGGLHGDPSLLFRNNGDGTFDDVTARSGLDAMNAEQTFSAAFGDYDLDGDLDMALAHWGTWRGAGVAYGPAVRRDPDRPPDTEHLWRNDSSAERIRFTKVSVAAGISPSILMLPDPEEPFAEGHQSRERDWTFTPTFARIDDDRYPDLLFVADFNRSQAFLNNGDGTFRNVTDTGVMIDDHGMGSAVADFDADGDLDWFVSSVFYGGEGETPDPFRGNRTLPQRRRHLRRRHRPGRRGRRRLGLGGVRHRLRERRRPRHLPHQRLGRRSEAPSRPTTPPTDPSSRAPSSTPVSLPPKSMRTFTDRAGPPRSGRRRARPCRGVCRLRQRRRRRHPHSCTKARHSGKTSRVARTSCGFSCVACRPTPKRWERVSP